MGESRAFVEAELNYIVTSNGQKPAFYLYPPPAGTPEAPQSAVHAMQIHDARAIAQELSLDVHGVTLTLHRTSVSDFYDDKEVKATYYPEVERLVAEHTGAARVVVFDHNVRSASNERRAQKKVRGPVRIVHNDYTDTSGPQRVRDLLGDQAETLLAKRFAMINVWRPIAKPVEQAPLAVCDARSLAPNDWVAVDLKYRDRTGEIYYFTFNPSHHWYYVPRMVREEALLLKCFDSERNGRARFTAHTAFDDPNTAADAAPRESIEARTMAFFN